MWNCNGLPSTYLLSLDSKASITVNLGWPKTLIPSAVRNSKHELWLILSAIMKGSIAPLGDQS